MAKMEDIVSLCKRRGFIWQGSDVYGGMAGTWDFGPLGVALKRRIMNTWWNYWVEGRDDMYGVDAAIIMNPKTWEASGHTATFADPLVECNECHGRFRADKLVEGANESISTEEFKAKNAKCPTCGKVNWSDIRKFNMMFQTHVGPVDDDSSIAYLRPETAQGIFVNYLNVQKTGRMKLPFGIAQIGKAFRNEIVARQFIFRMREFEQMEMQFFVKPGTELQWFETWKQARMKWHQNLGFGAENYRFHDHDKLAHYANAATDIEFHMPFGFKEVEGIHSRTNFDLSQHAKYSGKKIEYFDPDTNESYTPYVIETSIGVDRMFLSVLCHAYEEQLLPDGQIRTVLHLPAALAPVKLAIFPLTKKDGLPEKAQEIFNDLRFYFNCKYEEKDQIGKRYRRMDAIGCPYCITVDQQTLEDNTVTLRDRDTMEQTRVAISELQQIVDEKVTITSLLKKLA